MLLASHSAALLLVASAWAGPDGAGREVDLDALLSDLSPGPLVEEPPKPPPAPVLPALDVRVSGMTDENTALVLAASSTCAESVDYAMRQGGDWLAGASFSVAHHGGVTTVAVRVEVDSLGQLGDAASRTLRVHAFRVLNELGARYRVCLLRPGLLPGPLREAVAGATMSGVVGARQGAEAVAVEGVLVDGRVYLVPLVHVLVGDGVVSVPATEAGGRFRVGPAVGLDGAVTNAAVLHAVLGWANPPVVSGEAPSGP